MFLVIVYGYKKKKRRKPAGVYHKHFLIYLVTILIIFFNRVNNCFIRSVLSIHLEYTYSS